MSFVFSIIGALINIYFYVIIIYIFMSWIPGARESQFGYILGSICEPYLEKFRRFIPPVGMIDFSPIVALIVLRFALVGVQQLQQMF